MSSSWSVVCHTDAADVCAVIYMRSASAASFSQSFSVLNASTFLTCGGSMDRKWCLNIRSGVWSPSNISMRSMTSDGVAPSSDVIALILSALWNCVSENLPVSAVLMSLYVALLFLSVDRTLDDTVGSSAATT